MPQQIISFLLLILIPLFKFTLHFIWIWWWAFLAFLLLAPFKHMWLWWRDDSWLAKQRWELIEIRIPGDVDNPFRRMETALAGMWQMKIGKNRREKWIDGKVQLGVSLDIVSTEGKTHFYARAEVGDLDLVKTSLYAQFPNAELTPAEDYAKQLPADIPNKDWDLWASSYMMKKDDVYPIKTYKQFFEEQPTTFEEEAIRVDPLGQLLEGMSKIGLGEHMWVQIMASPIILKDSGHLKKAKKIVDKIVRRPEEKGPSTTVKDVKSVLTHVITGKLPQEQIEQESIMPPEMRITPGEKVIVTAIDEKVGKVAFNCEIRTMYIAKRDVFFGGTKATLMSYFNQFSTENLNGIIVDSETWTKVHTIFNWFLDKRRLYLRKRRHYRLYRARFGIHWPFLSVKGGQPFFLNIEELASIFHFPGKLTAPSAGISRVEAKRGEAPAQLPIE